MSEYASRYRPPSSVSATNSNTCSPGVAEPTGPISNVSVRSVPASGSEKGWDTGLTDQPSGAVAASSPRLPPSDCVPTTTEISPDPVRTAGHTTPRGATSTETPGTTSTVLSNSPCAGSTPT